MVGKNQLDPHTSSQVRNKGSSIHHRLRSTMARYSCQPRGTRSAALSDIANSSAKTKFRPEGKSLDTAWSGALRLPAQVPAIRNVDHHVAQSSATAFGSSRSVYRSRTGRRPKLKPTEISWLMKFVEQFSPVQEGVFSACSRAS